MAGSNANMTISWKSVAIGATTVALASVTSTAIIATVKKVDVLSVIVLAVAVVAFIVQILVFIVQAAAAGEQQLRAQEVYGSTLKALATIEEKAEGTRRTVSTISDQMLGALLGKAIPEAASSGAAIGSEEFSNAVADRVSQLLNRLPEANIPQTLNVHEQQPTHTVMGVFPNENEVRRVLPKISDLSTEGLMSVASLGEDYNRYGNARAGLKWIRNPKELFEHDLVRRVRRDWSDEPVFILNPDGLISAKMLTVPDIPANAPAELSTLRERLNAEQRRSDEIFRGFSDEEIPVER